MIFKNIFPGKGDNSQLLKETIHGIKQTQAGDLLCACQIVPVPAFPGTLSSVPMEIRIGYVSTTPTFTRMLKTVKERRILIILENKGELKCWELSFLA